MFNKYNGAFTQVSYLNNQYDGYTYIWNENIGYQFQLFKTNNSNLIFNLGPGLQERRIITTQDVQITPSWLSQLNYTLNLTNILTFTEQLQNIATSINSMTYSISSLTIQAYKNIGINLNYQLIYNSMPETGKAPLSTISAVNFVYSIN